MRTPTQIRILLNSVFLALLPVIGLAGALFTIVEGRVTALHLVLFGVGFFLTGFGITVGFHRLVTHHGFNTSPGVKALLLIFGSMAVEGPVIKWVCLHLQHHAHSDQPGDPHTPKDGLFYAHMGWMFDPANQRDDQYRAMVGRDPVVKWVSERFILWVAIGYLAPFLIGGWLGIGYWDGLFWGGFVRQFAVQHVTFAVNSVCHVWGSRAFPTPDLSRNNAIVGLFGLGEGWHNNHHAFPTSAFHGLTWWQIDLSGLLIRGMQLAGLVWDVRRPSAADIRRRQVGATPTP